MDTLGFDSFFQTLIDRFNKKILAFPWEDKNSYTSWCAQTYFYVRYSSRLIALAAAKCHLDQSDYHKRLINHLNEEKGHEAMALLDLKALHSDISLHSEFAATKLFYQNQFAQISEHGAHAFMGYVLALEGAAAMVGKLMYERAVTAHTKSACIFLNVHAEDDIEHLDHALRVVHNFSDSQRVVVAQNFEQSCLLYSLILEQCSRETKKITADVAMGL